MRQAIPCAITTEKSTLTGEISPLLLWPWIVCVLTLTAFLRRNVVEHYPYDTVLGFVLGLIVVNLDRRLEVVCHSVCKLTSADQRAYGRGKERRVWRWERYWR